MERRNDDYSDGHERYRQAPHGRPLESYEEPGAETPGPDPISSAFAPIQQQRGNFMPVVVPQPRTQSEQRNNTSDNNPQSNQQQQTSFQSSGSNFRSHDRNSGQHGVGGGPGGDRRPTPQPMDPNREIMPPPLTLPSSGGSGGGGGGVSRASAVVPASGPIVPNPSISHSSVGVSLGVGNSGLSGSVSRGVDPPRSSTTTSTTHDSIVPEFNSTPVPQRDQQVSTREYHHSHHHQSTVPSSHHHHHHGHHHGGGGGNGDHGVHSINNSSNHNDNGLGGGGAQSMNRANSPDFFGRGDHGGFHQSQREQQRQERLHHAGYTTTSSSVAPVTQQQHQQQQQRASIHPRVASPRYQPTPPPPPSQAPPPPSATRSPQPPPLQRSNQQQQQQHQARDARTLEQNLGLSQPSGEVHYGNSPMDDGTGRNYDEATEQQQQQVNRGNSQATAQQQRTFQSRVSFPAGGGGGAAAAPQRRTRHILVEVPMDTTDYVDRYSPSQQQQQQQQTTSNQFVHSNANYHSNAGTTSNAPPRTAYQSTPQSANVNPRVNFNERPRPQQLNNNEPLYPSSLPPPESTNQQVIQPQVAISPTTYHQPPPPNPPQSTNIGFNSYQQNTHNSNCHTCLHQQQHFQQPPPLQHGYQSHYGGQAPPPPPPQTAPPPPPPAAHAYQQQPMEHSGRHDYHSRRQVRDAPMDSDPDDDDFSDRGRDRANRRRSYDRGRFRSRQRRSHHHSRGSSHDSRDRDHSASSSSTAQLPPQQQASPMPSQEQQQQQQQQQPTPQQQQVALANNPNIGALVAQSRANNELLSLSSVSQQLQMQGLNHTIGAMLVPILKDQGVQQGCREMASTFQIQAQLKEMTQQMNENYKQIIDNNQQRFNDMMTQQILPTIQKHNAIDQTGVGGANGGGGGGGKGGNINDAPRTPQSCNSDRSLNQSRHPDLIRTPDSSVSGTYSDTDSPHSSGRRGRGNGGGGGGNGGNGGNGGGGRGYRPEPYPSDRHHHHHRSGEYSHRSTPNNDYPPSPSGINRQRPERRVLRPDIHDGYGHRHRSERVERHHHHHHDSRHHVHHHETRERDHQGGNSGGYSSAQSSPIDSAMEDNFQPNSISPTQNQYSDLSVDQVCEKLQEWTVSDEIIENFRREKIQGRHLNYLTEYMIKKGLLSKRTEDETPHRVRPIASRLGPLKTVCRALKMHVGQAKELQTTSTEREAVGLGTMDAVCVWLRTIGLSGYDRRFSEEQVFGSALLDLSESNLIELGMDKLGDRITFMLQREMLN